MLSLIISLSSIIEVFQLNSHSFAVTWSLASDVNILISVVRKVLFFTFYTDISFHLGSNQHLLLYWQWQCECTDKCQWKCDDLMLHLSTIHTFFFLIRVALFNNASLISELFPAVYKHWYSNWANLECLLAWRSLNEQSDKKSWTYSRELFMLIIVTSRIVDISGNHILKVFYRMIIHVVFLRSKNLILSLLFSTTDL